MLMSRFSSKAAMSLCMERLVSGRRAGDESLRAEIRQAQDASAVENSFARVGERYAELLEL
jgi:hypothetical protein